MALSTISKAIGAGVGGAVGSTAISGGLASGMIFPPDVSAPWWSYLVVYAIGILAPAIAAYRAPMNTP